MDLVRGSRADPTYQQAWQGLEESRRGVPRSQSQPNQEPFLRQDQQNEQAEGIGEKLMNEVRLLLHNMIILIVLPSNYNMIVA